MREEYKAIGSFGTLGIEIVLSVLFGAGIGWWGDGKLGTSPWLTLVGAGFGVAAAVRAVIRAARTMREVSAREEREQGNPTPRYDAAESSSSEEAPRGGA